MQTPLGIFGRGRKSSKIGSGIAFSESGMSYINYTFIIVTSTAEFFAKEDSALQRQTVSNVKPMKTQSVMKSQAQTKDKENTANLPSAQKNVSKVSVGKVISADTTR